MRYQFYLRRKKGPLPFSYVFFLSLIVFVILTLQGLYLIEKIIRPTILDIANLETFKIATSAINYAVSNTLKDVDMNKLVVIKEDEQNNISSVGFDANIFNQVTTLAVENAQYFLKLLEEGRLEELEMIDNQLPKKGSNESNALYSLPLGLATKNSLFAQFGPLIPVQFKSIGDVDVELNEHVEHVGINNTWIRISMDIEVQAQVIVPFASKVGKVMTTVPVGMIFVPGKVPDFYGGDGGFLINQ